MTAKLKRIKTEPCATCGLLRVPDCRFEREVRAGVRARFCPACDRALFGRIDRLEGWLCLAPFQKERA